MARIVFVTGGARSGKSRFAQRIAEAWEGPLLYVATAEVLDDEMADRVRRHRADRGPRWETLEEPLDLPAALRAAEGFGGALVDCLTLWVSNLLGRWGGDETGLAAALDRFYRAFEGFRGRICLVTNEVGSGIVPENALARRFRDLAGRVNQECAARAHEAYLVVSGLPVRLK
ncbi:bifunctional adenosylcobinamide kinase/adenosylcobinamide-phosphate guanylyltransferase [Deferrisoma sp.]